MALNLSGVPVELGRALDMAHLRTTAVATLGFFALRSASRPLARKMVPGYDQLSKDSQRRLVMYFVSFVHAALVSAMCLGLVLFPDAAIEADRVYGYSERACAVFALSVGFFVYDFFNCHNAEGKVDTPAALFMLHHVLSALCYVLVQAPFLQYYAVRLLLYELSTPFLNVRNMLLLLGQKGSHSVDLMERCFGTTFLVIRICMGIPLSLFAFRDVYQLMQSGEQHSTPVVLYFVTANLGLNGLNVFWLSKILSSKIASKRPASPTNAEASAPATKA